MCDYKLTKLFVSAIVFVGVSACTTVGPDYHVPEQAAVKRPAAAKSFASTETAIFSIASLPPQWWRLYDDPTLNSLLEKAFAANTDLRVASANLARARGALEEVRAAGAPEIAVGAKPAYGRASAASKGLSDRLPDTWSHDSAVSASYQLDLFGKIARGIEAANADTQAAQAAYDISRVTVAADTAQAYVEACSSGRQIIVAKRSVELQTQFVRTTDRLVIAGRSTPLDMSRARSQLEQLNAAIPPLQAKRRVALYRLAMLTGDTPDALPKKIEQCSVIPKIKSLIPVGDGVSLLRRRPDIRQAERALAAATARIGVATADLYPSISIGLSGGSSGAMSQLGHVNAFSWSMGPLISWTVPSTGSARSRIAQAKAGSDAALARFDATVLNALRETESALITYARELDRNAAMTRARDQSALAAQQADKLHRYGRTDFLTSLDANRTLAATESALAGSDAQLANYQIALFLALGGGWESLQSVNEITKKQTANQ